MIRRAERSDLPMLLKLCVEHAIFEQSPLLSPPDAAALLAAISDSPPRLLVWVAQRHRALVGYASGSLAYSTWHARAQFQLDCLYLTPDARGEGLGRQLMQSVRAYAAEQSCRHIEWVTPSWNEPALGFYRALGATDQLRQRFRLLL